MEIHYKQLTTSQEQRQSFRAHIINAVVKALGIARVSGLPNAAGPDEMGGEEAVGGRLPQLRLHPPASYQKYQFVLHCDSFYNLSCIICYIIFSPRRLAQGRFFRHC